MDLTQWLAYIGRNGVNNLAGTVWTFSLINLGIFLILIWAFFLLQIIQIISLAK